MKNSLKIFFIKGIPIQLHWTFLVFIAWVILMLVIAREPLNIAFVSIGELLAVFLCVLLHELGHALAAQFYQVPIREIQLLPIGGLTFFEKQPALPRQEIIISMAGPLVNVIIALLMIPLLPTGTVFWKLTEIAGNVHPANFFHFLYNINVILALLNLLPILPLDGGKILKGILALILKPYTAFRAILSISRVMSLVLTIVGLITGNLLLIIYGCFLLLMSTVEKNNYLLASLLRDETISDVISQDFKTIHAAATRQEILDTLCSDNDRYYVLTDNGEMIGVLDKETILRALMNREEKMVLKKLIIPDLSFLSADSKLTDVWSRLPARADLIMPVMTANKKMIGVTSRDHIISFLLNHAMTNQTKQAL